MTLIHLDPKRSLVLDLATLIVPAILCRSREHPIDMEISITAATRNRRFTKALVRHSKAVAALEQVGAYVNTFGLPFDVLQLLFLDRKEDYARAVGCKGDRLFQVEVATPPEETVNFADERAFVSCIADRIHAAIGLCRLPKEIELQLNEAIAPYKQ